MVLRKTLVGGAIVASLIGGSAVTMAAGTSTAPTTTATTQTAADPATQTDQGGRHHGDRADLRTATLTYLGLSETELQTQFAAGKTLAQIADSTPGKSASGLKSALLDAITTQLDKDLASGTITEAQKTAALTEASTRIDEALSQAGGPRGGRDHGGVPQVVTNYLGIDATAIKTQLASGKTLAQIADATPGKSAAGLKDALVADFSKHVDTMLNQTRGDLGRAVDGPGFGGHGRGHGHSRGDGPGMDGNGARPTFSLPQSSNGGAQTQNG